MATTDAAAMMKASKTNADVKNETAQVPQIVMDLQARGDQFAAMLQKQIPVEVFQQTAIAAIRRTPELLNCSRASMVNAMFACAQLRMLPNTPLQHCFIIPYKGEAEFQLGYRGLLELIYRGGNVAAVHAHVVRQGDEFAFAFGKDEVLHHVPKFVDGAEVVGAYAYVRMLDGGFFFDYMPLADLEKARANSPSSHKQGSPWNTWREMMQRKTVLRRLCNTMRLTVDTQFAFEAENATNAAPEDAEAIETTEPANQPTPTDADETQTES